MNGLTEQMKAWEGKFGQDYTDRNFLSLEEMELNWKRHFGITRTEANKEFLDGIDGRILEVGCNIGNQLLCLQKMGFRNLYGIELQDYAVELSKSRTKGINIIQGSAFDIPFKDNSFNLVFTSGVLIHIAPGNIDEVLAEIYRCSNTYIWGHEFFAEDYTEIEWRGERNLLWKTNFAKLWRTHFPELKLVKERRFKYIQGENVDTMFLLRKT